MNKKLALVLLSCVAASAQIAPRPAQSILPLDSTSNLPVQKIGVDDLIGISVYDSPELTRTVRVGADGAIRLPMVKARIAVEGLFPSEVEKAVTAELAKEEIMVDPIVTVSVVESRSRPISVSGAVKPPSRSRRPVSRTCSMPWPARTGSPKMPARTLSSRERCPEPTVNPSR